MATFPEPSSSRASTSSSSSSSAIDPRTRSTPPAAASASAKATKASGAIPTATTTTTSTSPLASTHSFTAPIPADGALEMVAMPTKDGSSTNGAKGSGGSDDDSKGSTYEIVSKVNPKTGKREYSMVWVEVTEKDNPKRFLGYLKLNPTGALDQASLAAQAISDLIDAAEAQDENFKKSSAQTTIKFDGVPAEGDEEGHEIAILTRGKEKVTLDPKKTPGADLEEKFVAFHTEIGKLIKIIKQNGADFDPRGDKATDAGDGKKKEPRDISKEEIDRDSLTVYLNRVQEGSSKICLQPITELKYLNTDANIAKFKGVTEPQFIPVEVAPNSYVYLCKDGTDLYYYNPSNATKITSQPNKAAWYQRNKTLVRDNTICERDSTDIGKALHKFAHKHGITQLHAAKETHAGDHTSEKMGIQWLAHLSRLSSINGTNAFFTSTPDVITVPAPVGGDALSTVEQTEKKTAAKKEGAEKVEEPKLPAAQPNFHAIFDGVAPVKKDKMTPEHKDRWLNALKKIVTPNDGSALTPDELLNFKNYVAPQEAEAQSMWSWMSRKAPIYKPLKWRMDDAVAVDALQEIHCAYRGIERKNVNVIPHTEFHAKVLDNLVKNEALCKAFCEHKGPWGASAANPEQVPEQPVIVAQPMPLDDQAAVNIPVAAAEASL